MKNRSLTTAKFRSSWCDALTIILILWLAVVRPKRHRLRLLRALFSFTSHPSASVLINLSSHRTVDCVVQQLCAALWQTSTFNSISSLAFFSIPFRHHSLFSLSCVHSCCSCIDCRNRQKRNPFCQHDLSKFFNLNSIFGVHNTSLEHGNLWCFLVEWENFSERTTRVRENGEKVRTIGK